MCKVGLILFPVPPVLTVTSRVSRVPNNATNAPKTTIVRRAVLLMTQVLIVPTKVGKNAVLNKLV